ncbi:cytidine deaminase [Endozoicomonas montiporae]|uniref:Cytidine deaminase n=1 Tax=Endozoicomonas montiporae CL-33 TaxID=570277 RepID=A0A142B6J6_9GAMM|nr:cytidine deaminase [Endozoicomonas montiporae]AMO54372.1 cytidine deaminase [Endozoicomonas montiporae CL-33]
MQTKNDFKLLLNEFPAEAANILRNTALQSGRLSKEQTTSLLSCLNMTIEELMKALLPLAASLSVTPISDFQVGTVAEGGSGDLYFGANLEFEQHPLKVTVHAEQCVVTNAWHQGETRLKRLMVNEAPCGHCRQFLKELNRVDEMEIIIDRTPKGEVINCHIADLLPDAFGPDDLGISDYLMSDVCYPLVLNDTGELAQAALDAAKRSHAPVSQSRAGVALQLSGGRVVTGRYGENAAFNPGISAMEAAIVNWRMSLLSEPEDQVIAAVMVEQQGTSSQRYLAEAFLAGYGIGLEYFRV